MRNYASTTNNMNNLNKANTRAALEHALIESVKGLYATINEYDAIDPIGAASMLKTLQTSMAYRSRLLALSESKPWRNAKLIEVEYRLADNIKSLYGALNSWEAIDPVSTANLCKHLLVSMANRSKLLSVNQSDAAPGVSYE